MTSEMKNLITLFENGQTKGDFTVNGTLVSNQPGSGVGSIAIGTDAGAGPTKQETRAVAIGYEAGNTGQQTESVSIGNKAGLSGQRVFSVAVGSNAGSITQQASCVAVGAEAGKNVHGFGGGKAIAIGGGAGKETQGVSCIAIGYEAGKTLQHAYSTILNATGSVLNSTAGSRFYVAPIREEAHGIGVGKLKFDPITSEITYSTT